MLLVFGVRYLYALMATGTFHCPVCASTAVTGYGPRGPGSTCSGSQGNREVALLPLAHQGGRLRRVDLRGDGGQGGGTGGPRIGQRPQRRGVQPRRRDDQVHAGGQRESARRGSQGLGEGSVVPAGTR